MRDGRMEIIMEYALLGAAAAAVVVIASALIIRKKIKKTENDDIKNETVTPSEVTENKEAEQDINKASEEEFEDPEPMANPQPVNDQQKQSIDGQIRFLVEHKIIPAKLNDDPIYITTSIIAEKGKYLANFYNNLYAQQKTDCPYTADDFNVGIPYDIAGAKAVKIEMPEKNLFPALCKRVYIVYNEKFTKVLYITVEATADNQLKLCAWIDSEHEEFGIIDGNEEQMISDIVADEEVMEEKYSDILDKLMAETIGTAPKLLTDPQEIQKHNAVFMNALMQSQKFKQEGKRDEALKLIREVIKKEAINYVNTADKEYHCFRNAYEMLLYANLYHPFNPEKQTKKQLEGMQVDLSSAYLVLGAMMLEQKQYDKAIEIISKAVEANPVNVQFLFALADAYKGKKYLKSFLAIIKRAHVCAYKKVDIARIYRNYAYYYVQVKEFELAANLAYASKYFDSNTQQFNNCMKEIEKEAEQTFSEPSVDELKKSLAENTIAWGAKELSASVINLLNQQFTAVKNEQGMKMCAEMINELKL